MKKIDYLLIGLLVLMVTGSLWLKPILPEMIPTHWNFKGEVDDYTQRSFAIWMIPTMTAVMLLIFRALPYLDPKRKNYKKFSNEWKILQIGIVGFLAYIHFVTLYISIHSGTSMMPLMFIGLGVLFVVMGNYLSKIRQNYFIGFKLPWTLADEDNWNKTHRYASWSYVCAGIITLVEAWAQWNSATVIFASLILASLLPSVYSFLLFKKRVDLLKYVYAGIVVAFLSLLLIL